MKLWQKIIIYFLFLAAIMITLYPPWVVTHQNKSKVHYFIGHRFIFSKQMKTAHIKLHDYLWSLAVVYFITILVVIEFLSIKKK